MPQSSDIPPEVEAAIIDLEHELSLLLRRSRANSQRLARQIHPDMDPSAYGLLIILQREGAIRLTELATRLGVGKPAISRKVAELEALGVVRKVADPNDGRAQDISLTDEGLRALTQAQKARRQVFHDLMADWEVKDLNTLSGLLGQLNETYLARDRWANELK
ncbi:MarR family winged helix-turn-helix transcriptional regulator [Haematomicrobium sanguinis]|uniref:MarR family winged helix-turn-helix transcriptional regulator n=1 Tax=Haematomicrobium sanguinis TaxID=479106 RepID=UPI00047EE686|nr:MarR family transcriptional regulator [Haematomicrobium sanguinis]